MHLLLTLIAPCLTHDHFSIVLSPLQGFNSYTAAFNIEGGTMILANMAPVRMQTHFTCSTCQEDVGEVGTSIQTTNSDPVTLGSWNNKGLYSIYWPTDTPANGPVFSMSWDPDGSNVQFLLDNSAIDVYCLLSYTPTPIFLTKDPTLVPKNYVNCKSVGNFRIYW